MKDNTKAPMTEKEALHYCFRHKDEYVRGFPTVAEGMRAFDCLVSCIESGHIRPKQLAEYGMEFNEEEK